MQKGFDSILWSWRPCKTPGGYTLTLVWFYTPFEVSFPCNFILASIFFLYVTSTVLHTVTVWDLNFSGNFFCVCVGGGAYSVSRMVRAVLNALDNLSNTRQGLTFPWRSSNKYCFNISGHMVLIALYIFSTGLFRLHPSTWLAELVWFTIWPGEIWQPA